MVHPSVSPPAWRWVAASAFLALTALSLAQPSLPRPSATPLDPPSVRRYDPNHVLVAFHEGVTPARLAAGVARVGLALDPRVKSPYFARLTITPAARRAGMNVDAAISALMADQAVRLAQPDYLNDLHWTPNDPKFGDLYGMHNTGQTGGTDDADIDMPEAWNIAGGSSSMIVAVIDTGVYYHHPDLSRNILRDGTGKVVGFDYYDFDDDPMDEQGHGTHVAGTIGAVGNNAIGVIGVCPTVRIMPLKMFPANGSGPDSAAILSLDFARTHGAKVINCSWGGEPGAEGTLLGEAFKRASDAGIVIACSAGNSYANVDKRVHGPSDLSRSLPTLLSVGASNHTDTKPSFSNYGMGVDLFAPGHNTLSTVFGPEEYGLKSGTSMASPHVAGAAALIWAKYPALTARQVVGRILASTNTVAGLVGLAHRGRLNVNEALRIAMDGVAPSAPRIWGPSWRSSTQMALRFEASGDDGTLGSASQYIVRTSWRAITPANLQQAPVLIALGGGAAAGTPLTFTVPNVPVGAQVFVAVTARDDFRNETTAYGGPFCTRGVVWSEDFEGATHKFTGSSGSTWGTTSADSISGSKSFSESPGGLYAHNAGWWSADSTSFVVPQGAELRFRIKHQLQYVNDWLGVEIVPAGESSVNLVWFTGYSPWSAQRFSLDRFAGKTVQIRLYFVSNDSVAMDGTYIDDIQVVSGVVHLADQMEGASQWTASDRWTLTTEKANSPTHSWTDSPGGLYDNNWEIMLEHNGAHNLNGLVASRLHYGMAISLHNTDALWFDVKSSGGWSTLFGWTGGGGDWGQMLYDLPSEWAVNNLKVRWRLKTDGADTGDGAWIDDVSLVSETPFTYHNQAVVLSTSGSTVRLHRWECGKLWGPTGVLTLPAGWSVVGLGDLNANDKQDLVIYRASDRQLGAYSLAYDHVTGWLALPRLGAGWQAVAFADIDGNGHKDILLFNTTTRALGCWRMTLNTVTGWRSIATVGAGWSVVAGGDMDGDMDDDLVLYHSATRQVGAWLMQSGAISSWKNFLFLPAGYSLKGVADVEGLGSPPDLVVERDSDGLISAYLWNGQNLPWQRMGPVTDPVVAVGAF